VVFVGIWFLADNALELKLSPTNELAVNKVPFKDVHVEDVQVK
jgi:hypothetical protein